MEMEKVKYSLMRLWNRKDKINPQSDYQRPEVWKRAQKQLLIDSILRGYDIPKIYVKREALGSQFEFEVIDGQQRLTAIWEFFDGYFTLPRDAEPIDGINCKSQDYNDLDESLQERFDDYKIIFVIVTDAIQDEETNEVGELFLRLQNGTPLNPQEKRNAMPGNMRNFVKELAKHDFFECCNISNKRYGYDQIAAKLVLLEYYFNEADRLTNVGSGDLDRFYKEQNDFDMHGVVAENVKRVLDYLLRVFPDKTYELRNHSVVTLYCLASKRVRHNIADGTEALLRDWFRAFEAEREENYMLEDSAEKKQILQEYNFYTFSQADAQRHIEQRLKIMEDSFYEANPNIERI